LSELLGLVESLPVDPQLWPRMGLVAADRAAVMGLNHQAYIYQGSNKHYDAYFDQNLARLAVSWCNLTTERHQRIVAAGSLVLSLFVPNKATCIPQAFPQPIPEGGTPMWRRLKHLLKPDPGSLFSLQSVDASSQAMLGAWLRTDSHWSQTGCLIAVNEILERLALPLLEFLPTTDYSKFSGDLSSKWDGQLLTEMRKDLICPEVNSIVPELEFDNYQGVREHFGRHVRWVNHGAKFKVDVTVVGNSFAGPGSSSRELTWWLARLFRSVTFLHMASIPTDVLEMTDCDVLIFQTVERFMYIVPADNWTYAELLEKHHD